MTPTLQNAFPLVGRLLLAALFLPAGLSKITGFEGTVGYINSVGLPMATLAAAIALIVEVAGSLALIVGLQTRLASLVLAVFTLVATFFFHNYWAAPAEQAFMQQLMFFKNVGVAGGLFVLAGLGAGGWSLDARRGA